MSSSRSSHETVASIEDIVKGVESVRTAGRNAVLLRLEDAKGDLRFVAVPVQQSSAALPQSSSAPRAGRARVRAHHSLIDTITDGIVPVHSDGYKFLAIAAVVTLVLFWLWPPLAWVWRWSPPGSPTSSAIRRE